jgi:hypothetical protein
MRSKAQFTTVPSIVLSPRRIRTTLFAGTGTSEFTQALAGEISSRIALAGRVQPFPFRH